MTRLRTKMAKDVRPIVDAALAAGWQIEERRTGRHAILRSPDGIRQPVPAKASGGLVDQFRKRMANCGVTQ